jgi:dihydrofolate reductase
MTKLISQMMMSVDGYFEGANGELDWHNVDEDYNEYAAALLRSVDAIVFGRLTYRLLEDYWTTEQAAKNDPFIAEKINELPKFVFSNTLHHVEWHNAALVKGDPAQEIRKLKQQFGKDLAILGSANLVSSLTKLGLIDEYQIMVNPVVLGEGVPLFQGLHERLNLEWTGTKTFRSGNVLLTYRPRSSDHR